MRHLSSANADPLMEAGWPSNIEAQKTQQSLFKEELEANDDPNALMAFDSKLSPRAADQSVTTGNFGRDDDVDSVASGHYLSQMEKKANLELVW